MTLRWRPLLLLAWRDLWHERWLALCTACVLAATLAPLWTLWGLEHGVIGTLIERQERDPLMRKIEPEGSGSSRFDAAWFERVRAWPDVAFVIPTVRSSAALVAVYSDTASNTLPLRETAAADPLLAGLAPPTGRGIVLSDEAARKLQVGAGKPLRLALRRDRAGQEETLALDAVVAAVLPLRVSDENEGFTAPALLESIEAWRDGHIVEGFGPAGNDPAAPRVVYPLFRMHAASIRDVQSIMKRLRDEGISPRAREREIESTLGLQRNLRTVLGLVAAVTVGGAAVALVALQVATVRRKRREYALLKLTGHGRPWLVAMQCLHALAVAAVGGVLAFFVYWAGAAAINAHFAASLIAGEAAVRLGPADVAGGIAGAMLISVLPALWGGWRASNVEAADELRDN